MKPFTNGLLCCFNKVKEMLINGRNILFLESQIFANINYDYWILRDEIHTRIFLSFLMLLRKFDI